MASRQDQLLLLHAYFRFERRNKVARLSRLQRFHKRQFKVRYLFITIFCLVICSLCKVERSIWMKKRSSDWWDKVVGGSFTHEEWMENFRMSKETFLYLCDQLKLFIARDDTKLRQAVSTEKRVAITLWRLATNSDYHPVGHLFGVSRGTVCAIVNEVCCILANRILPRYVKFPSGGELDTVVRGFETRWGFPQCIEAIDGTHIPIVAPHKYPDYYKFGYYASNNGPPLLLYKYFYWMARVST